jgi:preprotein translocase subunit YajC
MDVADAMLFALLALLEVTLMIHLHRRRQRRARRERMMQSLRVGIRKEMSGGEMGAPQGRALVLQQAR